MKATLRVVLILLALATLLSLVPAPAQAASPGVVVVTWGDTLTLIAARNNTTVDALVKANSLPNRNFVWAGQRLIVPGGVSTSASGTKPANPANPAPTGSVYIVSPGETLATIAIRLG